MIRSIEWKQLVIFEATTLQEHVERKGFLGIIFARLLFHRSWFKYINRTNPNEKITINLSTYPT